MAAPAATATAMLSLRASRVNGEGDSGIGRGTARVEGGVRRVAEGDVRRFGAEQVQEVLVNSLHAFCLSLLAR
jgi:hypothetical protein